MQQQGAAGILVSGDDARTSCSNMGKAKVPSYSRASWCRFVHWFHFHIFFRSSGKEGKGNACRIRRTHFYLASADECVVLEHVVQPCLNSGHFLCERFGEVHDPRRSSDLKSFVLKIFDDAALLLYLLVSKCSAIARQLHIDVQSGACRNVQWIESFL